MKNIGMETKQMKPLVSIITPTYNHEKFIGECIESVLKQTYTNWEMIVVDDCSTDETPSIVEKYAKSESRIKFIRHDTNWGMYRLVDTYNQALNNSNGEYIAILEGDDFWSDYKLEKQIKHFDDPQIALSFGGFHLTTSDGKILESNFEKKGQHRSKSLENVKEYWFESLVVSNFIQPLTVMIRKKSLTEIGGFLQIMDVPVVDYPTWLELSLNNVFFSSSEILGFHRRHSNAQSLVKIVEIASKNMKIAVHYLKRKENCDRHFIKKVIKSWEKQVISAHYVCGRAYLVQKDKREAKKYFAMGVIMKTQYLPILSLYEKFKCLFGYLCVLLNFDLERLVNFFKMRKKSMFEEL